MRRYMGMAMVMIGLVWRNVGDDARDVPVGFGDDDLAGLGQMAHGTDVGDHCRPVVVTSFKLGEGRQGDPVDGVGIRIIEVAELCSDRPLRGSRHRQLPTPSLIRT